MGANNLKNKQYQNIIEKCVINLILSLVGDDKYFEQQIQCLDA